ncbi:MAG: nucleotidyltransferase domain-containing protein [Nitrospirae bacterium]|nr:nucleotidyltransferase domain-containing protein [Nitrospirota bacterium]
MGYRDEYTKLIDKLTDLAARHYGSRLVTLAMFGSVARDTFNPDSDIDILIIAETLPHGRIKRIKEFEENIEVKLAADLKESARKGINTSLSPIIKTPEEITAGSPLFLDMTDAVKIYYDKNNFFKSYLASLKKKLDALGAKKIPFKGGYYWLLKPDYKFGDVIEL